MEAAATIHLELAAAAISHRVEKTSKQWTEKGTIVQVDISLNFHLFTAK